MRISYHPGVQRDVNEVLAYYAEEGGEQLAEKFFEDLTHRLKEIEEHPQRFAFYLGKQPVRRARLRKFPHVILFRILQDRIRVMVVKHEKRHPGFGLGRR
jgi:toxin ParE1/3/4